MINIKQKGNLTRLTRYLIKMENAVKTVNLEKYGQAGVKALKSATPQDTGNTANSWYYEIENTKGNSKIKFCNSNIQNGVSIAVILQYGHGTRNGGWVQGRDYINPAIQPIFDAIAQDAWKEVTKI